MVGGGPGRPVVQTTFGARVPVAGGWVFDLAAVAVLVLAVRALRVGITYDAEHGVTARGILQSHRWTWPQLDAFQIQTSRDNSPMRIGAVSMHKMLRVVRVDGSFTVLRALVAQQGGPADPSWLDEAASALNGQVRARHRV